MRKKKKEKEPCRISPLRIEKAGAVVEPRRGHKEEHSKRKGGREEKSGEKGGGKKLRYVTRWGKIVLDPLLLEKAWPCGT